MSIEALRALALSRNAERRFRLTVCLDDGYMARLRAAEAAVAEAGRGPSRMDGSREKKIADAQARLEKVRAEIPEDATVVAVFRPVTPGEYEDILAAAAGPDRKTDFGRFYPALCEACYVRAESLSGEDLGVGWKELVDSTLTGQDYDNAVAGCVALHRSGQTVDFQRGSSGPAGLR